MAEGVTHIYLPLHKNTIGGTGENKTDEQTRTKLGVNQEQKEVLQHFISVRGLSVAWVTSENSTSTGMLTSFDSIFFAVTGPSLLCYCLRSPVLTAPVRGSTPTLFSVPPPTTSQLRCPANSHSRPLTTSGYGEISGPSILCLVSRQNRQRNRLLWRATHIVLHTPPLTLVIYSQ